MSVEMEMPKYRSHKVVHALKIKDVQDPTVAGNESDGSRLLIPADDRYGAISVGHEFVRKHQPFPGGYYIVYPDGYKSYSPAESFEDGYDLVP